MSRIGKQPVSITSGTTVEVKENTVTVKGPKGELKKTFSPKIKIEVKDNMVTLTRIADNKESRALHGLTRNLIANMIEGVTKGFKKELEITGVGYRAKVEKNRITLTLGFSHPVEYKAAEEIEFKLDEENKSLLTITGIDKQVVGETAAKIRSFKKPEPYKGKGIKYLNEQIARKAGKSAALASAGGAK